MNIYSNSTVTVQNHKIMDKTNEICLGYHVCSPSENCQLSSYRSFNAFLSKGPTTSDVFELFKIVHNRELKPLLLIDVNQGYLDKIKTHVPKDEIVMESKYTSSNGSFMAIVIINVKKFIARYDAERRKAEQDKLLAEQSKPEPGPVTTEELPF